MRSRAQRCTEFVLLVYGGFSGVWGQRKGEMAQKMAAWGTRLVARTTSGTLGKSQSFLAILCVLCVPFE